MIYCTALRKLTYFSVVNTFFGAKTACLCMQHYSHVCPFYRLLQFIHISFTDVSVVCVCSCLSFHRQHNRQKIAHALTTCEIREQVCANNEDLVHAYTCACGLRVYHVEVVWESNVSPQCELLSSHRLPLSPPYSSPLLTHSYIHMHTQVIIRPRMMEIKYTQVI